MPLHSVAEKNLNSFDNLEVIDQAIPPFDVSNIHVLKFGSSVLTKVEDMIRVATEISNQSKSGALIVAVVSALGGETNSLLGDAAALSRGGADGGRSRHLASLLATGEMRAASLLAIAVEQAGLMADVLNPMDINLMIAGDHLDAEPVGVGLVTIQNSLKKGSIVIIPGFFGKRSDGKIGLLGRGGSDLTALFLAEQLGASKCKLVKDVDGIYSSDPNKSEGEAKKFEEISWQQALAVSNELVQPKAIELAERYGVCFEVGSLGSSEGTRVGYKGKRV
jgi:homoserine dehydrogenase